MPSILISFVWYGPQWAQASTAPSRLFKAYSTQGGIRVPFILRYPPFHQGGNSAPGGILDQVATVMDIPALILDLAGIQHPSTTGGTFRNRPVVPMKGKSMRPLFEQGETIHGEDEALGFEVRNGLRTE